MSVTDSRVKNGSLTLGGLPFSCQPTSVSIKPENEGGSEDSLEVLCGDLLTDATNASLKASLVIKAVQDFTAATGSSLIAFSWQHNNQEVAFEWSPTKDAADKWTGKVIVQALEVGGEVAKRLETDAEWAITDLTMPSKMGGTKVIGAALVTPSGPSKASVLPGDTFPAEATVTASDSGNAAKLSGLAYVPAQQTAWTQGQKFTVGTFDFSWNGSAWVAGAVA